MPHEVIDAIIGDIEFYCAAADKWEASQFGTMGQSSNEVERMYEKRAYDLMCVTVDYMGVTWDE